MKLAVITDEIDTDLARALDVMLEYDIKGVELRAIWDKNIVDAPLEYWERAKALIQERGMHVIGVASPFYKCDMPGVEVDGPAGNMHSATATGLADQIEVLKKAIAAAQFFDTKLIRIFSFWRRGPLTPEIEDKIVDALGEAVEMAQSAGVVLGMENEHACYLGTGAQAARVLQKVDSPYLRSIWDPGNAYFDGELPFPDGYEAVKPFIAHVHIKDADINAESGEPEWTVVGEGKIDFVGQIGALRASGYDGYLSLETHYRGKGSAEASSRACIEGLLKLLA